ncbi:hypothetical protein GGX14DRAFT_367400, partial [Mycena pura]
PYALNENMFVDLPDNWGCSRTGARWSTFTKDASGVEKRPCNLTTALSSIPSTTMQDLDSRLHYYFTSTSQGDQIPLDLFHIMCRITCSSVT